MDSSTSTAPYDHRVEDDEWELCNDDGFVYKRKKRRLDTSTLSQPSPCTEADLEARQERSRRERKKNTLFKLKVKYRQELNLWDSLSSTLTAMEAKARQFRQERQRELQQAPALPLPSKSVSETESVGRSLLNELVLQVDAQEAVIQDVANLCDIAEAVCYKQEERFRRSLFDLPIWDSAGDLLAALCDNDKSEVSTSN